MAGRPDAFLLFFILLPVIFILYKRYWRGKKDLAAIGGKWRTGLLMDVFQIKWFFSSLLFILFILFIVLALADFTGRGKTVIKSSSGIDIVFAVDISGSMLGADIYPSRLKRSTDLISAFIENLPGERFGLVVFKGTGSKIIPITEDSSSLSSVLPFLNPDMFSSIGSNLEDGIKTSLTSFTSGEERKKIILLFTDGESLTGSTSSTAKEAKSRGVDILIFGAGTESGTELYSKSGEPVLDKNGDLVISRLNKPLLNELAVSENIFYFSIEENSVLNDSLELIGKQAGSSVISNNKESRYKFFLSTAILFLFLYISVRIFPWKNTF
ncbi:MAG: VWA domain-containing protein [Spirochaetales bacterium]|nr:VWA domain-containing protein [Spirochaetales bacterium]